VNAPISSWYPVRNRPGWTALASRSTQEQREFCWQPQPRLIPPRCGTLAIGHLVVAVDIRFAPDPSWAAVVSDIAVDARSASLVDSVVTVEDATESSLFAGLVEQMALVRSLLGSFDHLGCIHRTARQHALVGHSGRAAVSLTAIASQTPGSTLRMDVVSAARRWQAHFDDTALARPTEITIYDGNGALSRPLLYASGRRSTWMQLHAAITEQASIPYSLEDLATDLEIVKRALNEPAQASPAAR
jgi:hypothetical protein